MKRLAAALKEKERKSKMFNKGTANTIRIMSTVLLIIYILAFISFLFIAIHNNFKAWITIAVLTGIALYSVLQAMLLYGFANIIDNTADIVNSTADIVNSAADIANNMQRLINHINQEKK